MKTGLLIAKKLTMFRVIFSEKMFFLRLFSQTSNERNNFVFLINKQIILGFIALKQTQQVIF
jgi:hypothetical protein